MKSVIVVIGAGSIGRRLRAGQRGQARLNRRPALGDRGSGGTHLEDAGFDVSTAQVDASSRPSVEALVAKVTGIGEVVGLIHAAGVSPSQASPADDSQVDLYGTALVLEEFGHVDRGGGVGRRHRFTVRSPSASAVGRSERGARDDARRRAAPAGHAPARSGEGLAAGVPDLKTRELVARDGRGGSLGEAWRATQHHQPRDHHDAARER